MTRIDSLIAESLLALAVIVPRAAQTQTFTGLDPTFGKGGKVTTNFGINVRPSDVALQPDGKIVVSTDFYNTRQATIAFGVARYRSHGAFDGSTYTSFTNFINSTSALTIQPDGKIVVVGEASSADGTLSEFAIARFNPDLSLDSSFGSGGKVTTNFVGQMLGGVSNPANTVLIQPDQKILVGGSARFCGNRTCPTYTALARYNPDGSLDGGFGNGGEVMVLAIGPATSLAVLTTGDILVLNLSAIAQFSPTGNPESVTSGTIAVASHGGLDEFQLSDSKYILGSGAFDQNDEDQDVQILRFTPTGGPDTSFNSPLFDYGAEGSPHGDGVQAVAVAGNGKIAVAGISDSLFGVARLNSDGSLDRTFGVGGKLTTRFNGSDQVLAVIVQTDSKTLAVGQTSDPSSGIVEMALARYR